MTKKPKTHGAWQKDPVTAYARAVVARQIVAGPYVRLACQRHLDDLERAKNPKWPFRWDIGRAHQGLDPFPDLLTVEFNGEVVPFRLLDWSAFVVGAIFGWVRKDTGFRRFQRGYLESGKGSGKSPLLGGIGVIMLMLDGELSAEVYSAGPKREQSMILFKDATDMIQRSPRIRRNLKPRGKNPVQQWTHEESGSIFKPLSSDKTKSGPRVSCALVDELHEHKNRYTIDMLGAGFKGRKQPLMMIATNAGFDRESICWEWHEHSVAVVSGLRQDDALFAFVMALDEGDDPLEDESCWEKTNPGIDITVTRQYLRQQVSEARDIPGRESGVRRLNFCEWTDSEATWVTRNAWVANEEELGDVSEGSVIAPSFFGAELYCGLDMSFAFDLTALAFAFPEVVELKGGVLQERLACWIEYFTPIETAAEREKKDRVPYPRWIRDGLVHGVPGKVVRKEALVARLNEVREQFDLRWVAYDRYAHKELAAQVADQGIDLPWIEHPQGFRRGGQLDLVGTDGKKLDNPLWMPDSVQKFEARLLERTISIQPSPVTRWQVSSAVIRQDPSGTGNRVFDKMKATGRIDGIVALAQAIGAAEMRLPVRDLSGFLANPVRAQ